MKLFRQLLLLNSTFLLGLSLVSDPGNASAWGIPSDQEIEKFNQLNQKVSTEKNVNVLPAASINPAKDHRAFKDADGLIFDVKTEGEVKEKGVLVRPVSIINSMITVEYSGAPDSKQNWIGLFKEADADLTQAVEVIGANTQKGKVNFKVPVEPGYYELRFFSKPGYKLLGTSRAIPVGETVSQRGPDLDGQWKSKKGQLISIKQDETGRYEARLIKPVDIEKWGFYESETTLIFRAGSEGQLTGKEKFRWLNGNQQWRATVLTYEPPNKILSEGREVFSRHYSQSDS